MKEFINEEMIMENTYLGLLVGMVSLVASLTVYPLVLKYAREHGIAAETIGSAGHQMLGTRRHFRSKGVHRIAIAFATHINDRPNAKCETVH